MRSFSTTSGWNLAAAGINLLELARHELGDAHLR